MHCLNRRLETISFNRRHFLTGVSAAVLMRLSFTTTYAFRGNHADDVIPVTSLPLGKYSQDSFKGFSGPTSSIRNLAGFNSLTPDPDNGLILAISKYEVRDIRCSTYFGRGAVMLRLSGAPGAQRCFYFSYNGAVTGGDIRVGIKTGFDSTHPFEGSGTDYAYYVNTDVAASVEGKAAGFANAYSSGDHFTFGVEGLTVFLQWNGTDLIRYTEWRLMTAGRCGIWTHEGYGARDIIVNYPVPVNLHSDPDTHTYDVRDFGMREVAPVTGSMSAATYQLVLRTDVGFKVGDKIIVETGGENGRGLRGTIGVGGQWPSLFYPDLGALMADVEKPDGTFAYLLTNNFVYSTKGGVWSRDTQGGGAFNQGYYFDMTVPISLVAKVTEISEDGRTLTLDRASAVATNDANVWLDCAPSFFIINQIALTGATLPPFPSRPVSITIPAGNWRLSDIVTNGTNPLPANGITVRGAGQKLTVLYSPKGTTCGAINLVAAPSDTVIEDLGYEGNCSDHGSLFKIEGNDDRFGGFPSAFTIRATASSFGLVLRNIDCLNSMGRAVGIDGGTSPMIENCSVTMKYGQHQYMGWQIQLSNAIDGKIKDCKATGAYLLKSFELFACSGTAMTGCSGTNALFSFNSCTSCSADTPNTTIGAASFFNTLSGGVDEPILSINNSAFGSGSRITVINPRIIQTDYVDASNNSLKAIQVLQRSVTDVTISGVHSGSGDCKITLGGLLAAPNYSVKSAEYGSMGIYSDAPRTIVSGIRVKGSAIGPPGHSGHFGNISVLGPSSQVKDCVADVIQPGPSEFGNLSNAMFGDC